MHAPQRGGEIESYPRIFIAAGEVSGDRQAAYLARAILSHNRHVQLYGSGGEKMIEATIFAHDDNHVLDGGSGGDSVNGFIRIGLRLGQGPKAKS